MFGYGEGLLGRAGDPTEKSQVRSQPRSHAKISYADGEENPIIMRFTVSGNRHGMALL